MLSRLSAVSRQVVKPCVAVASQRCFSMSSQDDNKYAWHKTAWPAWQMYKDKAGESGATMFTVGLAAYLLSKEIFIINDEVLLIFAMGGTGYQLSKVVGPVIGNMLDERRNAILDKMNKGRTTQLASLESAIEAAKEGESALADKKEYFDIMKSNNEMRLEIEYRRRLQEVESEVQKRLDYQVDLQNLKQSIEEDHISSWVENQVVNSLTAKHETDAIAQCITDLNALAESRAAA